MNLLDKALFYLSVPKCVCCKRRLTIEENPLCDDCDSEYKNHKRLRNCSVCSKILSRCVCANDYLNAHYVKKLIKVCRYTHREDREIPSNYLVYSLKQDNRKDVLEYMAKEILDAICANIDIDESYVITAVPRRRKNVVKYGIDHASLLAKKIAKELGIPYISPLKSLAKSPQKEAHGSERITNAVFDYKGKCDLNGKRVILVDDIVTTGASMGACATLLHGLRAKEIIGCAFSIAYKDKPNPMYHFE